MQSLITVCFLQSDAHTAAYVPVMKRETISPQLDCVGCFSPEPSKSEGGAQKRKVFSWLCFSSVVWTGSSVGVMMESY